MSDNIITSRNIHWLKEIKIPNTPWTIKGYSKSAYRTGFYIKELDIMLDSGTQNFNYPTHIFITHTHIDHCMDLGSNIMGQQCIKHIYAPASAKKFIDDYIKATLCLSPMEDIDPSHRYIYHGLDKKIKDNFDVNINNFKLNIQVFECDHTIPTISFGFSQNRKKLKKEYLGLNNKEICDLKKSGIDFLINKKFDMFAYVCDTSIEVFNINPEILNYNVIMIECTFLFSEDLENAIKRKHIHWEQLKSYVIKYPKIHFILFHFSRRYKDKQINDFFNNIKNSDNITNIEWFV